MVADMSDTDILIVEDDPDIPLLIEQELASDSFSVVSVGDAHSAREYLDEHKPDLVLLDLNLPDGNGLELCRELKDKEPAVIIISAMDQEEDVVRGLETGADDYLTKPFSTKILHARIGAVLRRLQSDRQGKWKQKSIEYGHFRILPDRHEVLRGEEQIPLTKSEFKVFSEFCKNPGIVFTRNQIVEIVHGEMTPVTSRSVDVMIVGLRQKLGDDGGLIETVRGIGYRLRDLG